METESLLTEFLKVKIPLIIEVPPQLAMSRIVAIPAWIFNPKPEVSNYSGMRAAYEQFTGRKES
jgi:hypothetical protein